MELDVFEEANDMKLALISGVNESESNVCCVISDTIVPCSRLMLELTRGVEADNECGNRLPVKLAVWLRCDTLLLVRLGSRFTGMPI